MRHLCGFNLSPGHFRPRLVQALERVKASAGFFTGYTIERRAGSWWLTLHKGKTLVKLLPPQAHPAQTMQARENSAIELARLNRARVAI